MAENYKHLYEQMKHMVEKYQDEIIPGFRKQLENSVPVVRGKWKYYHKQNKAVCTVCSFERDLSADFGRAVVCPNCGAKMDKEKE